MPPLTQGSTLTVEEAIGELVAGFRQAEDELRDELERVTARILDDPDSSARYRRAQIRGILGKIAIVRSDLEGRATVFVDETLARIYVEGMGSAERALGAQAAAASGAAGAGSFTGIHREALEVLAADAFDDLAAATDYLDDHAKRIIREASKVRVTVGAARGATVAQDTSALARRLADRGVTSFVDKAGRGWSLARYAETVVRTKSAHAYNTGRVLRAEETGTDAFEIRDGDRSGHEECLAYNGRTCSASWALANPTQHPNCVRSFGPLPLHRGGVDYGSRAESAAQAVRSGALHVESRRPSAGEAGSRMRSRLDDD